MDVWRTTVEGSTYADIMQAIEAEYERFFEKRISLAGYDDLHMHIDVGEIVTTRDGFGVVCRETRTYRANVNVEF
jgi:hypothetical protein